METNTTKKNLEKMSVDELGDCTFVASAIHHQMKKGALTSTSIHNLSRQRGIAFGPVLYIPKTGKDFIEFGITRGVSTPMRFHDGKYLQLPFSLPSGHEKEFSDLVETLDDKFFDGEIDQEGVYTQLKSYLEYLGQ